MKLSYWIFFETPGEKAKLKAIMEATNDEMEQIVNIQETFQVDLLTASKVITTYNNSIRK